MRSASSSMGRAVGQDREVPVARTHVVMADEVLEAVDRLVGQRGRSRFLEEAAREKLTRVELDAALRATAGVIRTADHPEWRNREATTAWVSELREGPTS